MKFSKSRLRNYNLVLNEDRIGRICKKLTKIKLVMIQLDTRSKAIHFAILKQIF